MDTIKFVIEKYINKEFDYSLPTINIYINDHDLIDLISEAEHHLFAADDEKIVRSSYIGYETVNFERFQREMRGQKTYRRSILLTCTCTIPECDCIMADISIDAQTVTWSGLKSPWLGGITANTPMEEIEAQTASRVPVNYAGLGPFVFDREQYFSALEEIIREIHNIV